MSLCGGRDLGRDDLDGAARGSDLRLRGLARPVSFDRELLGELALAEDLDRVGELGHEALRAQRFDVYRRARSEHLVERRDVDRERFDAVRVLEATLRNAARHRHLTTL